MKTVINSPELNEILNLTPSNQNILLVGRHEIGKSEILTNYFEKKKLTVVPLFLGQMADPGDLIGLPYFNKETGHTEVQWTAGIKKNYFLNFFLVNEPIL